MKTLMDKERLLILAPHTDDENFGCGGLIARTIEEGGEVYILVFTKNYAKDSNYLEFYKAVNVLDMRPENCYSTPFENQALKLDQVEIKVLITKIEEMCKKLQPTTVAIPFIGSFHQDHEVIAKAAMSALRPHGYMPKKVLMYEQPYYGVWTVMDTFKPNYYVDITKYLDKKLKALECYKSQKIPFDMVKAMAKVRGSEIGVEYAEAYMLMREIV